MKNQDWRQLLIHIFGYKAYIENQIPEQKEWSNYFSILDILQMFVWFKNSINYHSLDGLDFLVHDVSYSDESGLLELDPNRHILTKKRLYIIKPVLLTFYSLPGNLNCKFFVLRTDSVNKNAKRQRKEQVKRGITGEFYITQSKFSTEINKSGLQEFIQNSITQGQNGIV